MHCRRTIHGKKIFYIDEENDKIVVGSEDEFKELKRIAKSQNIKVTTNKLSLSFICKFSTAVETWNKTFYGV